MRGHAWITGEGLDRAQPRVGGGRVERRVAELNGQLVMLVRCEGDKVPWHTHADEDELFFVLEGELEVQERDRKMTLRAGEMCVVERGTEHRVVPNGHVKLMLFEPA